VYLSFELPRYLSHLILSSFLFIDLSPHLPLLAPIKLAGSKRRSFSSQGGLLNRMFGGSSSPPKEKTDEITSLTVETEQLKTVREEHTSLSNGTHGGKQGTDRNSVGDKKRRSTSVSKAAAFLSTARNSLTFSHSRELSLNGSQATPLPQTQVQRLGKMDPALSVPQGSLNNSAGESLPTQRSSFRVGVTEDRNRKCRRTMEDTHAYLYNFLGTPAPAVAGDSPIADTQKAVTNDSITDTEDSTHVVETDNGTKSSLSRKLE
jgi:protein phosphatase PTC1